MRRRELIAVPPALLATTQLLLTAWAQTTSKRVGVLFPGVLGDQRFRMVRQGIDAAPREGELIVIDARSAQGDLMRLRSFADEFVAARVDVILAIGSASPKAAAGETQKIPIVALDLETDPVASGVAASLFRPGGNVTGIFFDAPESRANGYSF